MELLLMLHLRPELGYRLHSPELFTVTPASPYEIFTDQFGNRCVRLAAPAGQLELRGEALVDDGGWPAPIAATAVERPVADLPPAVLPFLLSSRYCEVDLLGPVAWELFGGHTPGWSRVQAVCDWVHQHLRFDDRRARATRTARQAYEERVGVGRDFTHLAITLCRCLNLPARYASGYLGTFGVASEPPLTDFSACMQVYLGGGWHTFDVRHNVRRIGFLPIAFGRDVVDVAHTTCFGPLELNRFSVETREVPADSAVA